MTINPFRWYCDVCGDVIQKPEDGYVIWKVDKNHLASEFHIIHKGKCNLHHYLSSLALADLVGPDGLSHLLSFLSVGPLRAVPNQPTVPEVANIDEFVDFIRRLQIPLYEDARRHFGNHGVKGEMAGANEFYPYTIGALGDIASGRYDQ